jgi:hypothetical protein
VAQKAKLFRRDLMYLVEYATTQTQADAQVIATRLDVGAAVGGATSEQPVATVYH